MELIIRKKQQHFIYSHAPNIIGNNWEINLFKHLHVKD